jgi:hypothetical protein
VVALASLRVTKDNPDALPLVMARRLLYPLAWFVAGMPDRRPWWVYVLKPVFFFIVQVWSLPYRARNAVLLAPRGFQSLQRAAEKGTRRFVADPWKEGMKRVRSRTRYAAHRARVNTRHIGARVLRVLTRTN